MNTDKLETLGLDETQITKVQDILNKEISGNYVPLDKFVDIERRMKSAERQVKELDGIDIGDLKKSASKVEELEKEIKSANDRVKQLTKESSETKELVKKEYQLRDILKEKVVDSAIDDAMEKFNLSDLQYSEDGSDFSNFDDLFTPFSERYAYMVKPEKADNNQKPSYFKPKGTVDKKTPTDNPVDKGKQNPDGSKGIMAERMKAQEYFNDRESKAKAAFGLEY